MMENVGLVLEGGGMRGLYTAGVLDFFLDKELYFNYIIGVSAGACNAVSYISRQRGRNKVVNTEFIRDSRYLSIRNLFREKSLFGMNFIFDEIPNKLVSFDFEAFSNAGCSFVTGTTDCTTGEAVFFQKEDVDRKFTVLRASSSLPMASPIVSFKGRELLDGGIAAPIPIHKSIEDGNTKNIIVLTRNFGYRKKEIRFQKLFKAKYREYPGLIEAIKRRHVKYNEALDYIEQLENEGKAVVIRPSRPLSVDRMEKDRQKLYDLYNNGYEDARAMYDKIVSLLENRK